MPYGLKDTELEKLRKTFAANERIERVVLYGSRAKGNYKPFSDVDITLEGPELTLTDLNHLSLAIDDLLLPYQFDISIFHTLKNHDLIDHIQRIGITIFERESEWKEYKLGDLIKDIAAGPFGSNLKVECFVESGFPIIDGANLKGIKVTDNITKYVTEEKARSLHRAIAKRNDVVVTISGNVGQIAYIPDNSKYLEYLVSQRQFRATFDVTNVDVPFLVYYFHTRVGQHKILSFANQVGVPALAQPLKNFREIELELPPIEEQKRIAGVLSSLDDKIDLLHRENATLEQMAETLFRQWFVVEAKEDWEEVTLGDVAILNAGGDKPKIVSQTKTSELNVPIYSNGIDNEGLYGYTDSPRITEESVTISARGTIGYVVLRTEPFVPIVRLITIRPKEKVSSKYLYYWAKSQNINGTGTTQQQLTVPDFKLTKFVLPKKTLIDKFTNIANLYYDKIIANQKQIRTLIETRDGLLPRLMNNEIKL